MKRAAVALALMVAAGAASAHTLPTAETDCRIYDAQGRALSADDMSKKDIRQVLDCEKQRSLNDPLFRKSLELKFTDPYRRD